MARKKNQVLDFEQSLSELGHLIEKMEQGNLSLEESLQQFERGITLIRECQKTLAEAEQKVQILMKQSDEATLAPHTTTDEEA
jgi:exodeoxyribonuclease VII small subunit